MFQSIRTRWKESESEGSAEKRRSGHNGKENSRAASRQQDEGPENAETAFP